MRARWPHRAPVGWYEFARGLEIVEGTERAGVALYGYLEEGAAMELRRRGPLNGEAEVLGVACCEGVVRVTDPRAEALARREIWAREGEGR